MSTQPLVSIVTPAFNSALYLGACIASVVQQTYANWDMWIVDDASTDNTEEVVKPYLEAYPNIHYSKLDSNSGGAAVPRNVALQQTNASIIAFLDADDMFMPTKLQEQVAFMQDKHAAISYTGYCRVKPDGQKEGHYISAPETLKYKQYLNNTCICLSSSMVDREQAGDISFNEKYKTRQDLVLWMNLFKNFDGYGLNKDLTRYRRGHSSLSSNIVAASMKTWEAYHDQAKDITEFERIKAFCGYAYHAVKKRLAF